MTMLPSSYFNERAARPSDLLTYVGTASPDPCRSTQTHHLIPREIWTTSKLLKNEHVRQVLNITGGLEDPMNLMELPSTSAGAQASNLALHNGSHPVAYNEEVLEGLKAVETAYTVALAANGGVPSPQTDLLLTTSIHALQLSLRQRLDRSSGILPQLTLSNSDPNAYMSTPEYRAEMVTLGSVVDGVQADPRLGYPSNASAQRSCQSAQELTAEQLRTTAAELRGKAWAGVPDGSRPEDTAAGVLAKEEIEHHLPQMKERTLAEIYEQTAKDHPFDAAMFKVGAGMIATAGGIAAGEIIVAAGEAIVAVGGRVLAAVRTIGTAATAAAASGGGILITNPAEGSPVRPAAYPLAEVLPATHAEIAKGADEMGDRSEVNRIAIERAGGPAQGHLTILTDGKVQRGSIPFGNNPPVAAGKSSGTLGILYEGQGRMNAAQQKTLKEVEDWLRTQRQREGLDGNIEVIAGSTATAEILGLPTPRGPLPSQTPSAPIGILTQQPRHANMSAH